MVILLILSGEWGCRQCFYLPSPISHLNRITMFKNVWVSFSSFIRRQLKKRNPSQVNYPKKSKTFELKCDCTSTINSSSQHSFLLLHYSLAWLHELPPSVHHQHVSVNFYKEKGQDVACFKGKVIVSSRFRHLTRFPLPKVKNYLMYISRYLDITKIK